MQFCDTAECGTAWHSRNQRSADSLVRESEPTTDEHADKAVRAPKKSSRLATISTDTDRLQICATRPRWELTYRVLNVPDLFVENHAGGATFPTHLIYDSSNIQ